MFFFACWSRNDFFLGRFVRAVVASNVSMISSLIPFLLLIEQALEPTLYCDQGAFPDTLSTHAT